MNRLTPPTGSLKIALRPKDLDHLRKVVTKAPREPGATGAATTAELMLLLESLDQGKPIAVLTWATVRTALATHYARHNDAESLRLWRWISMRILSVPGWDAWTAHCEAIEDARATVERRREEVAAATRALRDAEARLEAL